MNTIENPQCDVPRVNRRILGGAAVLYWSWFLMMAVHESGHAVAALATGGGVRQITLQPLSISRTDVDPNPYPLLVVWAGPAAGCVIPLLTLLFSRGKDGLRCHFAFFAGFCLIANGAYIGGGAFDQVGDCRVMLQHGSPMWLLFAFGGVAVIAGFWVWHGIGSFRTYLSFSDFDAIHPAWAISVLVILGSIEWGPGSL